MSKKIEDIVCGLAQPIAEKNNCEVADVEFKKEGASWFLRIFIDKEEGITIDDCEAVSKEVSEVLDKVDPIEQSYYLEVSSPGLDRPLKKDKDFERFMGYPIEVKLYKAMNGEKVLFGKLEGYKDNVVYIKNENDEVLEIPREQTAIIRLVVEF